MYPNHVLNGTLVDMFFGGSSGLSLLQFSLLLLEPANDAVAPAREAGATEDLREPLSHYWAACSHNSYIVGDQLTGRSTADAYRRQLLQVTASDECSPSSNG